MTNARKADVLVGLSILALLLFSGCVILRHLPPGPICSGANACSCWETDRVGGDWRFVPCERQDRFCAALGVDFPCDCWQTDGHGQCSYLRCGGRVDVPSVPCSSIPTPSPSTPTPSPTAPSPSPTPTPSTVPTPVPTPTPCVPTVEPFKCPAGTVNDCWQCSDRIAWDIERGNWTSLPGSGLLYNDPGGNVQRREYLDRACNLVTRSGSIIRTAEQQFGIPCVDGNAVCPASRVTTCPTPSPSPSPSTSPGPTPTPGPTPAACPPIGGLGGQVHQFVNAQHQTVPYHREGDGGRIYVADGPVAEIVTDSTVMFGCGAPRCACDGEHDGCGGRVCEDPRGQTWRVVSGPHGPCETWNNGQEGDGAPRGYGYRCVVTAPGDVVFEACTGEPWIDGSGHPVPGRACVQFTARVR